MVRVVDPGRGQAVPALHLESIRGLSGGSTASLDDPFEELFAPEYLVLKKINAPSR